MVQKYEIRLKIGNIVFAIRLNKYLRIDTPKSFMMPFDLLHYLTNEEPSYFIDIYNKSFKGPHKKMKKIEGEEKSTFSNCFFLY